MTSRCAVFGWSIVLVLAIAVGIAYAGSPYHLWSQRFGDAGTQHAYGVACDASGNFIVVGKFTGSQDFGGIYFVRLRFDGQVRTSKIILMK